MRLATLPNLLSASRLVLAAGIAMCILRGLPTVALALAVIAIVTDVLDGRIARRTGQVSAFGTVLDHGADAVLVSVTCGFLAREGVVAPAIGPLIALAFIQYALDHRWLRQQSLRASALGRTNGIAYFVVAVAGLVVLSIPILAPLAGLLLALSWVLVATTLVSMAERLWFVLRIRSGTR